MQSKPAPRKRGILFSGPMVRAILEGRKTQTRRIITPKWLGCLDPSDSFDRDTVEKRCPYGVPGDRLWVRETWASIRVFHDGDVEAVPAVQGQCGIVFKASDPQADYHQDDRGFVWRPSIFLPCWASRITLELTSVRVERLQEISNDDARAEGMTSTVLRQGYDARAQFCQLWDSINGKRAPWESKPWVWVVGFRRAP